MMSDKTMFSLFQEEAVEKVFLLLLVQEAMALSVSVADGALMVVTKTEIDEMKSSVLKSNLNLSLPSCSVPHSHMCPTMQHCSLLTLSPTTVLQTIPC